MPLATYCFYLRFYIPLAVLGLLWMSGNWATNYVLLANEGGIGAFATYTLAMGLMAPINALFVFAPQMSTVMARGARSRLVTFRFLLGLAGSCAVVFLLLGLTPLGLLLINACYQIDAPTAQAIQTYLAWLGPLLLLDCSTRWFNGQLIQAGRTATTTALQALALGSQVAVLLVGFAIGLPAIEVIIASAWASAMLHLLGEIAAFLRWRRPAEEDDGEINAVGIARYFLPMATTSLCFAMGKMGLLALLTRNHADDPTLNKTVVAAFGLLMSLNMLFNLPVNQLRHCFTAHGCRDPQGVQRFHWITSAGIVALAFAFVCTPAARWFLADIQAASGPALDMALAAAPIIVLFPLAIAYRSEAQGWAMARKRTGMMAVAAVTRLVLVTGAAALLLHWNQLGAASAAVILAAGFAAEAIIVRYGNRHHSPTGPHAPAALQTA